jgi:SAM-dependent methyltransferase
VELFYEGNRARETVVSKGLLDKLVFELGKDGEIPFADQTFSMIVSNQVFEHIEDLDYALAEIMRVLEPGGLLFTLFPTKEVWREGHCGIPFSHWFPASNALRYPYVRLMRAVGLGYHKGAKSQSQWVRHKLAFLDNFTSYRTYGEILTAINRHSDSIEGWEADYLSYRLERRRFRRVGSFFRRSFANGIATFVCRKLAGVVLVVRKPIKSPAIP